MSNQEETDTRIVLYLKYAVKLGYKSAVVRTPGTDIFDILLFHAKTIGLTIFLDIGTGKHHQTVNISQMAESTSADKCKMVLGLNMFTGRMLQVPSRERARLDPLRSYNIIQFIMKLSGICLIIYAIP